MIGRPSRRGSGRERGAALVEFALIGPLLFLLLLGIIDFGIILSNSISVRQGAREAARQGAVASFGPTSSCGAELVQPGSANMRSLICLAKARSDVTATDLAVAIRFDPNPQGYPAPTAGTDAPVGNSILVCTAAPMTSVSKLFSPLLKDKHLTSKAVMRIEQGSGVAESPAAEADPTGENWNWCTP